MIIPDGLSFTQRAERLRSEAMFARGDAVWLEYLTLNKGHIGEGEVHLIAAANALEDTARLLRRIVAAMETDRDDLNNPALQAAE